MSTVLMNFYNFFMAWENGVVDIDQNITPEQENGVVDIDQNITPEQEKFTSWKLALFGHCFG